jgi:deoxyadenosine/deoxycytidine kinase
MASFVTTRPRIIAVEGNIGAGKSTLLEEMKQKYAGRTDILFLQEPVGAWTKINQDGKNMIELFYHDQKKYSFAFQIMAYTTRLRMIEAAVREAEEKGVKVIVMERSLDADRNIFAKMLYDQGDMEPCMFQIYENMSEEGLTRYMADGILWVNTPPEECEKRIKSRGREGEHGIHFDYLVKCDQYHREWLGADTGFVYIVDDEREWDSLETYLYP